MLNRGHQQFRRNCAGCHGSDGKASVPSAQSMRPPPRDLTSGYFKFTSVAGSRLPTDSDLQRTIRTGLQGTSMPAWTTLSHDEVHSLVQYIKTLSPRWSKESVGNPVQLGADPWSADPSRGISRGQELYHHQARCWQCHPAYLPPHELPPPVRASSLSSLPVPSHYGPLQPPDFLTDRMRASRTVEDLARVIAVGVGGTPMPSWIEQLPLSDIWALAHYVDSLTRLRATPEGRELQRSLRPNTSPSSHEDLSPRLQDH